MTDDTALTITNPILPANLERSTVNPAAAYLASLGSEHSRRTVRSALDTIAAIMSGAQYDIERKVWLGGTQTAQTFPWVALRSEHTKAIRAALAGHYKYSTTNKMLSALRGVLQAAYDMDYLTPDEYKKALNFKEVKGSSNPTGRDISEGEIIRLIDVCRRDTTAAGARDLAIIGILWTCGLRRAELAALTFADYTADTEALVVRHGKGNRERTVYVTHGAKTALEAWLVWRGTDEGSLFCRIGKRGKGGASGKLSGMALSTQAVYIILAKRAKQAGLAKFSPHDFRRTFVGNLLDKGADINTVSKLAGHASVTTTGRYDRRTEDTKRKAASLLHFPI
ncbi:MAG: tyrosine-type recombinase/integrase [Chloroflexota bacterium]